MPHIYTHLLHTVNPHHHFFLLFDCYIPLFGPLPLTNGAFDSVSNAVWAHKMVGVEEPPLIWGPPRRQGLCSHSTPQEGKGEVANSDFVPLLGTPTRQG